MKFLSCLALVGLAVLLCLLNALKPLTLDDAVYHEYARHIASHPLDPYGFQLHCGASANDILAPAGFLYWWGAVYRLVGEWPLGWKLGLLPVCLLLVFSLADLAARLAPGRALSLVAIVVLSPFILPGLNLMLDVPALALSLAAVAIFLRAVESSRFPLALAAGLVAGLAMQTKYTAFVLPALFVLAGWLQRRPRLGLIAAGAAVLLFVSWEAFLAARYGRSHFLVALGQRNGPLSDKARLILPLVGILGGGAGAVGLVTIAGLRGSRRLGWLFAGIVLLGYQVVAVVPESQSVLIPSDRPGRSLLDVKSLVFGLQGVLLGVLSLCAGWKLLRLPASPEQRRTNLFLLGWLGLELAGYLALSPYPAVRRVLGLVVVGTLAAGSLAAQQQRTPRQEALVRLAVVLSALAGLIGFAVDFDLYRVERRAALQAAHAIRHHLGKTSGVAWYGGNGNFAFYAERRWSARPRGPGREPPARRLAGGAGAALRGARRADPRCPLAGAGAVSPGQSSAAPFVLPVGRDAPGPQRGATDRGGAVSVRGPEL